MNTKWAVRCKKRKTYFSISRSCINLDPYYFHVLYKILKDILILLIVSLNQWYGDYKKLLIKMVSVYLIDRTSSLNIRKTRGFVRRWEGGFSPFHYLCSSLVNRSSFVKVLSYKMIFLFGVITFFYFEIFQILKFWKQNAATIAF